MKNQRRKRSHRFLAMFLVIALSAGLYSPGVYAAEPEDEVVAGEENSDAVLSDDMAESDGIASATDGDVSEEFQPLDDTSDENETEAGTSDENVTETEASDDETEAPEVGEQEAAVSADASEGSEPEVAAGTDASVASDVDVSEAAVADESVPVATEGTEEEDSVGPQRAPAATGLVLAESVGTVQTLAGGLRVDGGYGYAEFEIKLKNNTGKTLDWAGAIDRVNGRYDVDNYTNEVANGETFTLKAVVQGWGDPLKAGTYNDTIVIKAYAKDSSDTYQVNVPVTLSVSNPTGSIKLGTISYDSSKQQYKFDHVFTPGQTYNLGTLNASKFTDDEETYSMTTRISFQNTGEGYLYFDHFSIENENTYNRFYMNGKGLTHRYVWVGGHSLVHSDYTTITVYADNLAAGTYTADLVAYVKPYRLKVLNASDTVAGYGDAETGEIRIPISFTVTGTNPNLPTAVKDLKAQGMDGQVQLTWKDPDRMGGMFHIFRKEGKETATRFEDIDLDEYEGIGEVSTTEPRRFLDSHVENGKTYSYLITMGEYGFFERAYNCMPVSATPSAGSGRILRAPEIDREETDREGYVRFYWTLDYDDDGTYDRDGTEDGIDHFLVYRDGLLVAQVDRSDIQNLMNWNQSEWMGYKWSAELELPYSPHVYHFQVRSVGTDGSMGEMSESYEWEYKKDGLDSIVACVYWDKDNKWLEVSAVTDAVQYKLYRNGAYIGTFPGDQSYVDKNITTKQTYTYRMVAYEYGLDGASSEIQIYTDPNVDIYEPYNNYVQYRIENGKVYTEISPAPDRDGVYRLYRNGTVIQTVSPVDPNHGTYILTDEPKEDGTYIYALEITGINNRFKYTCSNRFTYVKDSDVVLEDERPSAPKLEAGVDNYYYEHVHLEWEEADPDEIILGYYLFRSDTVHGTETYSGDFRYKDLFATDRYMVLEPELVYYDDEPDWTETAGGEPIEYTYYLCAFNEFGVSAPSKSFTFKATADGHAPVEIADEAPGAPIIREAKMDYDLEGYHELVFSWDPAKTGGKPSTYRYEVYYPGSSDPDYTGERSWSQERSDYYSLCDTEYDTPAYGIYTVKIYAVNAEGENVATVKVPFVSYPTFSAEPGNASAVLSWSQTKDKAASAYRIYRKEQGKKEVLLSTVSGTVTTYTDTTALNEVEYLYAVEAVMDDGETRKTDQISVMPMGPPKAPINVKVKAVDGVLVTWDMPEGSCTPYCYKIYCNKQGTEDWYYYSTGYENPMERGMLITEIEGGKSYRFYVVAENEAGESEKSTISGYVTVPQEENWNTMYPYPVTTRSITEGTEQLTITWQAPDKEDGYGTAVYYEIWRADNYQMDNYIVANVVAESGAKSYTWTDKGLDAGTWYFYYIQACNGYGGAPTSNVMFLAGRPNGITPDQKAATAAEEEITALLAGLPDISTVTLDDTEVIAKIKEAYSIYDTLTDRQKKLVSADVKDRLLTAYDTIRKMELEEKYGEEVAPVRELIADLPTGEAGDEVTLADEGEIEEARAAYNNLPKEARTIVDTTALDAAEAAIRRLKREIQDVNDAISAFPDISTVNAGDPAVYAAILKQIEDAEAAYNALTDEQKERVANVAAIQKAKEDLAKKKEADDTKAAAAVTKVIEALPDASGISADGLSFDELDQLEAKVAAARKAYDSLTSDQKKKAQDALARLTEIEKKVTAVHKEKHVLTYVPAVAATLTKLGTKAHYRCACGKLYSDAAGTKEVTKASLTVSLFTADGVRKYNGTWYYVKNLVADYSNKNRFVTWNGNRYYFGSAGTAVTGWKKAGAYWYYMDPSTAAVQTGWKKVGKKTYYFKADGAMAANEWCKGYWLNKDGSWTYKPKATWKKDKKGWWFGDTSGWYAKNCRQTIDGKVYYFNSKGYMATGEWYKGYWYNKNGTQTYKPKGTWKKDKKGWWFSDSSGWYAKREWQKIDGYWYYFDYKGYMVNGSLKTGGKTYYFDSKTGRCLNP